MTPPSVTAPGPSGSSDSGNSAERKGSRRTLRKVLLWALLIPPALCALLLLALTAAGWWVERVYLQDEIRIGAGTENESTVRVHGVRFEWWRLNFRADSVWYRSPALDARAGGTDVRVDWIDGILALRPAARLDADSLWLLLRGDSTAPDEPMDSDSIAFPDFSLPVAARVRVRALTVEDSAGTMLRARGITVRSRGGQRARARVDSVETRWTGNLRPGASASLDWSQRDSLGFTAVVRRGEDSVSVTGRHAKRPLWHGRDSLAVVLADVAPYYRAFGVGEGVPRTVPADGSGRGGVRLTAVAALGDSLEVALQARIALAEWDVNPDFTLSPQQVEVSAAWMRDRGTLVVSSAGRDGEDVSLSVTARVPDPESFPDSTRSLHEQVTASLQGYARGLRVMVRDTLRPADAVIERAAWNGRDLDAAITTRDSSRIEANMRLGGPVGARRGTFELVIRPEERWVKVFAGDIASFQALEARGTYHGAGPLIAATVTARGVRSYGVTLDSLRSHHEYSVGTGRYTLKPSRLYAPASGNTGGEPTAWTLSGVLTPSRPERGRTRGGLAVDATLAADDRGSLRYVLEPDGTMVATAENFEATALPYAMLDSLPLTDGVLNGTFRWNPRRKDGSADLKARLLYTRNGPRGRPTSEPVEAVVAGEWTSRLLALRQATVSYRGSDLTARARLLPRGKQFYEIASVPAGDYEFASVETGRFDLADILNAFQAEAPLESGVVRGGLSFSDTGGFAGSIALEKIGLKDAPDGLVVRLLRLEGHGDTLIALARTTSETVPWFDDSVYATLTGARGEDQHVRIDAHVSDSLHVRAEGDLRRFASLKGSLRAIGSLKLPQDAGTLRGIDANIEFDFPDLSAVMAQGTLNTRTFAATYDIPGQPRQRLSLNPSLRDGKLEVSSLRIENDAGQALNGRLNFSPADGTLTAKVQGDRFAARWTDDYAMDVRNLVIDITHGPGGSRARANFSSGTFTYADLPLRVQGRLGAFRLDFTRPPLPPGAERYQRRADTLRVSGVLQESELRYRLRNLGDIQRLLGGSGPQRPTVGTPLMLDVKIRTTGNANRINTDMARLSWVGDLAVSGVHPYTLYEGRVSAQSGEFGLEREAYAIRRLDVKWLNAPVDEGEIHMEARKQLASSCGQSEQGSATDSCTVITRLDGSLSDMQFSYDSDCGGAYGAGADVAAILYSVQRGCYDGSLAGGENRGYGERALTLLEPTISRGLTQIMGPFWGSWIETADVTGLGSLSAEETDPDSLGEALSLALTSREYRRFRIKVRSGYHLNSQDLSSPMENMLALEWRIPLPGALRDSAWRRRLDNNLRAAASVETKPVRRGSFETDEIERKIGLFYNYAYWGEWWAKKEENEE